MNHEINSDIGKYTENPHFFPNLFNNGCPIGIMTKISWAIHLVKTIVSRPDIKATSLFSKNSLSLLLKENEEHLVFM